MIAAALPAAVPQTVDLTQGVAATASDLGQTLALDEPGGVGFGRRLQQFIDGPALASDPRAEADAIAHVAARPVPVTDLIVCGIASSPVDDAPSPKANDDASSSDPGADLAAQLALVSQWVALAQTPSTASTTIAPAMTSAPTVDTPTKGRSRSDALDVADKLTTLRDLVRAAPARDAQSETTDAITTTSAITAATTRLAKDTTPIAKQSVDPSTRDTERDVSTPLATLLAATPKVATFAAMGGVSKDSLERPLGAIDSTSTSTSNNAQLVATLVPAVTSTTSPDATTAAAIVPTALRESVGTTAWTEEFGRAAVHVATTSLKEASLRLNPEHLGPLDVRVRIDDGVAHLNFQASHVDTRHALEASRPMLDQLFSAQGLSIGDYSVDDRASGNSAREASSNANTGHAGGERRQSGQAQANDDGALERVVAARLARPLGLVDTFA